jgi:hypothetical protein
MRIPMSLYDPRAAVFGRLKSSCAGWNGYDAAILQNRLNKKDEFWQRCSLFEVQSTL